VDARTAQWLEAFANPAPLPSSEGIVLASAPIGTVGDAGYFDDSGAYIVPAQLIWPDGTTNTLASSSDGEPMLQETEVRETAPAVELLVNPETGLPDFKYTSSVVNTVNEGLDNAFSGRTMQAPGESPLTDTLQGLAYGAGKAAFELIAPVGDFLQVGNELGRSLITGEAPGEIDFISGIGQMAAQGATTADIINGGFVSLLATPDRIGDAYERGDYRSMGEEFGALGLNAALAGAGLRGSMPSVKVGVQLAAEDFAASGVGQRFGAAMEGYQYQTGALSYASEPGLKVPASWQVGTNRGVAGGELTGIRTTINLADDAATIRSLTRENESATTLANNGYKVQQNPPTLPNGKNPDYIVNGQVFDNYAPSTGNVRNAARVIEGKVAAGQADNIVVNLADSSIPPSALRDQLMNYPIPGLKQVIIIDKSGTPTVIKLEGN
jgi:hypothetical protein